MRPLTREEIDAGASALPGAATHIAVGPDAVALHTSDAFDMRGFSGVFGSSANNADVFRLAFEANVAEIVAQGGTANLFSYG